MKKIKFGLAIVALSMSASASAMPAAVPGKWWDQMWWRLEIMASNPGFCRALPEVPMCQGLVF